MLQRRELAVVSEYERHARELDERHYGIPAADVVAGAAPAGPVLSRLRTYPVVLGFAFGMAGSVGPNVRHLHRDVVRAAARRDWRAVGARTEADARSFLSVLFRTRWAITAARAGARQRLSLLRFVGLSRAEVERMRREPRPPVAGRDPAAVSHAGHAEAYDVVAGALLREPPDVWGPMRAAG